jgi:VIT1/CCC1 family predicted Fe2+/Mn2+ transporter
MYSQKQVGYIVASFVIVVTTLMGLFAISSKLAGIALFIASWYCVYQMLVGPKYMN